MWYCESLEHPTQVIETGIQSDRSERVDGTPRRQRSGREARIARSSHLCDWRPDRVVTRVKVFKSGDPGTTHGSDQRLFPKCVAQILR